MSKKKDSLKPWLSRPAINRSVTLPLTRPLTQRLSNLNEFHPNELDPYLLFDARDSMIGTLENPTLDLDPSKPDTLNVITATRAGVATFTDVNGNIASAPANTVRVDYVDSVPMILVEPSATNTIRYSEDYTTQGNFPVGYFRIPSSQTDGGAAPMAGKVGKICTFDSNSDLTAYNGVDFSSGDTVCQSIYVKKGSASKIRFYYNTGTNARYIFDLDNQTVTLDYSPNHVDSGFEDVGNGWFRIYFSITLATAAAWPKIFIDPSETFPATVELFGFQLELGSKPTSYIPTSGGDAAARTRAADNLEITGSAFSDFYNNSEGTIYCEFKGAEGDFDYVYNVNQISTDQLRVQRLQTGSIRTRYRTSNSDVANLANTALQGSLNRHAFSYKTNDFRANVNGGNDDEELSGNASLAPTSIQLGGRGTAISITNIKRLIYWPYHSDSL